VWCKTIITRQFRDEYKVVSRALHSFCLPLVLSLDSTISRKKPISYYFEREFTMIRLLDALL
jgi:hypothetical protein